MSTYESILLCFCPSCYELHKYVPIQIPTCIMHVLSIVYMCTFHLNAGKVFLFYLYDMRLTFKHILSTLLLFSVHPVTSFVVTGWKVTGWKIFDLFSFYEIITAPCDSKQRCFTSGFCVHTFA